VEANQQIIEANYHTESAWRGLYGGRLGEAMNHARELIRLLADESFRGNGFDVGFGKHTALTVLGIHALSQNEIDMAVEFLLKSADIGISPTVSSRGPSMHLARELLKHERWADVETYLEKCLTIWREGAHTLLGWRAAIQQKEIPDFVELHNREKRIEEIKGGRRL
jgi:hypothetical protein